MVGAAVGPELRQAVRDIDTAHRASRDELADLIRLRGADPDPAEASYEIPFPIPDAASGLRLAAVLEDGVAQGYGFAMSRADSQRAKGFSLTGLTDAALRLTSWHQLAGTTPASPEFPGL